MRIEKIFETAVKEKRNMLTVKESLDVLHEHGIPVAEHFIAKSPKDAKSLSEKLGYPVALKVVSRKVSHKTDMGGVYVNLSAPEDVEKAANELVSKFKKSELDGILVQKMIHGQEVIVGGKKDPQFGQTVLFGTGGVYAEIFKDISVRVTPIRKEDADEMVKETRIYNVLKGFRGKSYDLGSVRETLMKISNLLEKYPEITELDINPLIVRERPDGAVAVDARIVLGKRR